MDKNTYDKLKKTSKFDTKLLKSFATGTYQRLSGINFSELRTRFVNNEILKEIRKRPKSDKPQYKPSGLKIASQFGITKPVREKASGTVGIESLTTRQKLKTNIQRAEESHQNVAQRGAAAMSGVIGGINTEWKPKEERAKTIKKMGSTVTSVISKAKKLTPWGMALSVLKSKPAGAGSTITNNPKSKYTRIK